MPAEFLPAFAVPPGAPLFRVAPPAAAGWRLIPALPLRGAQLVPAQRIAALRDGDATASPEAHLPAGYRLRGFEIEANGVRVLESAT